jgi:hypothetical protein
MRGIEHILLGSITFWHRTMILMWKLALHIDRVTILAFGHRASVGNAV